MRTPTFLGRRAGMLTTLLVTAVLATFVGAVQPAHAISLQAARASGVVGETPRGYVAPVGQPNAEVAALVNEVNNNRRSEYEKIAKQQGISVEQVGIITANKVKSQLPAGSYVMNPDGSWVRK